MLTLGNEKLLARIIAVGAGLTTIFVVTATVTDPVNTPKLVVMGIASSAAFGIILAKNVVSSFKSYRLLGLLISIFLISALVSVLLSDSPKSQGFYGSYGRNNGLLTYVFLAALLISSSMLSRRQSILKIINWLLIAGLANVIYALWVILFGDFVGWENPYGNILGTLGNPNFIGAFLGIFIAAYVGIGFSGTAPLWFKYSMLLVVPVTAFEIYDSSAIQGRIVGLSGFAIVGFFMIRARFNLVVTSCYTALVSLLSFLGLLGALQVGPLTSIIYKTSVSLRGQYWLSGWNTGEARPFKGVGMDAFGDWYRRSRDAKALELPGVNTIVNAAHNVPIDMFAFGGWPLFISYLLVMGWGGVALVRMIFRTKHYDPILVVLTTSWFGYQLQSIISINQIGLAIWGWVLTGAAIAYERITVTHEAIDLRSTVENKSRGSKISLNSEGQQAKDVLAASVFGLVGLLLALPPFTADVKWRAAQVSQTVETLESTLNSSYFNPQNSNKYINNILTLEQSNLNELAHKYALEAVEWNPESFDLWKILYLIKNSTPEEKRLALTYMKRLDPLNPDVTALQ
jgi:hypothetical protein